MRIWTDGRQLMRIGRRLGRSIHLVAIDLLTATAVDVTSGRQKINRNQMFTNFMAMADRWRRRSAESIRLPSPMGRSIIGLNNAADELWDILWNFGYDQCDDRHGWAIPGRMQYVDDP